MSLERLAHYLDFSKPRRVLFLPLGFLAGGLAVAYFLPRLVDPHILGGAPVVQILLEMAWFWLMVWGLLGHRRSYRKKYGERAYRKIMGHFFFWAGILMFTGILRPIWVSGESVDWLPLWLRLLGGGYFMAVGLLLEMRGVRALGIDQVVLVYTIFPERAHQVQSQLYQFLRHPLYAALSHIGLGIALLTGTLSGFLCTLVFMTKLWIWSKVEEKELIEKFGEGYLEYRKKVPAFVPRLKTMGGFFKTLLVLCLMLFPLQVSAADLSPVISERLPYLKKIYTDFHQNPELSKQERETSAKLARELKGLGFEVTQNVGGFGVAAVLRNGEGPTGLIRTDMDALPIQEETGLSYASHVPGVMHACGHDMHMSVFLGTAYALTKIKDQWRGTLVMIGQPAEELGWGAHAMIEAGLFTKFPKPDYALALHVMDYFGAGTVGYTRGFALANVDSVDITVFGKGGHGAKPNTAIDPVILASQIVLGLQTLVSREIDPVKNAVVTVGSIHGGSKHNIIPDEVRLQLTVRSYEEEVRRHLQEGIRRIAENLAQAARAPRPQVIYSEGTPSLYNDPLLASTVAAVFEETLGRERVKKLPQAMWGEDFARYGREGNIPILLFGLGAQPKGKENGPSLHSPRFAPDVEPTLKTGIQAMTAAFLKLQSR